MNRAEPYLVAIVALVVLWSLFVVVKRDYKIWRVSIGSDGLYSTSKFQVFLWTVAILFTYVAVFWARVMVGKADAFSGSIPQNVLIALGLVLVSGVGAYGITSQRVNEQVIVKNTPTNKQPSRLAALIEADNGQTSLVKMQVLAWTAVALFAYIMATAAVVADTLESTALKALPGLPDIDPALLVLMGLGQGVYLGGKLIQREPSGLIELRPEEAKPGDVITAIGVGLGDSQGESDLRLRDMAIDVEAAGWNDTEVKFKVPDKPPWGGDWKKDELVRVNVVVGGKPGATAEWLTVKKFE